MKKLPILLFAMVFAACATPPFKLDGVNQNISPTQTKGNDQFQGQRVVWGGMIVETKTFDKYTQIEVLSYPLDDSTAPIESGQTQGRFLLKYDGFLEPAEYASGRWLSAIGLVQPSIKGNIGSAEYHYAVLEAQQIHLWSEDRDSEGNTRFHFGIGIGIRL